MKPSTLNSLPPLKHSKIMLVICTTITRLTLTCFVKHCVMYHGAVFPVVMLRRHGHYGRICFSVLLMLLFLKFAGKDQK